MSKFNPFQKLLWTATLGGLAALGLGVGCVITVGSQDCSECGNTGCHSQLIGSDCFCDPGYEFANSDPNDFDCDRIPGKGGDANCNGEPNTFVQGDNCFCVNGFNWCNPGNNSDLSCCEDDMQAPGSGGMDTDDPTGDPTGGTADGTADETGDPDTCMEVEVPPNDVEPDDADCTETGLVFCSNNSEEGPAGSRFWECVDGVWVENPQFLLDDCTNAGFDFAFGCVDNGKTVEPVCGLGPGTPCSGPECDSCVDDDLIEFCADNRLSADSCSRICSQEGIDGVTFDTGVCISDGGVTDCFCCDEGDEGCPI